MKLLADEINDVFGNINPPVSSIPTDPQTAFSTFLSLVLKLFIFVAILSMAIYLLLGAYEWITSGGEKDKLTKAQNKITHAIIGMFVVIIVLSVFCVLTVDVFHINNSCLEFNLPQLGNP